MIKFFRRPKLVKHYFPNHPPQKSRRPFCALTKHNSQKRSQITLGKSLSLYKNCIKKSYFFLPFIINNRIVVISFFVLFAQYNTQNDSVVSEIASEAKSINKNVNYFPYKFFIFFYVLFYMATFSHFFFSLQRFLKKR